MQQDHDLNAWGSASPIPLIENHEDLFQKGIGKGSREDGLFWANGIIEKIANIL